MGATSRSSCSVACATADCAVRRRASTLSSSCCSRWRSAALVPESAARSSCSRAASPASSRRHATTVSASSRSCPVSISIPSPSPALLAGGSHRTRGPVVPLLSRAISPLASACGTAGRLRLSSPDGPNQEGRVHVFWESVVEPVLEAVAPSTIVEVGAWKGQNTRNLVEFAAERGCSLHVIDPEPLFDPEELGRPLGDAFVMHGEQSLNALPLVGAPDLVLIDGDHNWYTVFHELQLLEKGSAASGHQFPVVLLHDVDWPYGRRDLYYDPQAIPDAYRLPFKQEALLPGSAQTVGRHGLNPHLNNAIYQHNLRNGVRTAIEDFVSGSSLDLTFQSLPGDHGLGIDARTGAGGAGHPVPPPPVRVQLARVPAGARPPDRGAAPRVADRASRAEACPQGGRIRARGAHRGGFGARDEARRELEERGARLNRVEETLDGMRREASEAETAYASSPSGSPRWMPGTRNWRARRRRPSGRCGSPGGSEMPRAQRWPRPRPRRTRSRRASTGRPRRSPMSGPRRHGSAVSSRRRWKRPAGCAGRGGNR